MKLARIIGAALLALGMGTAAAQEFPSRPITLIVGYPPGGNTDLMARALQPELSRALGQTVVVQNRGGAAGTIGAAEAARARPDGLTLLFSPNNPITAQPHQVALSYNLDSFRFLCLVYDNPQVVVLGRQAPFTDLAGMVAFGRSAREALIFGSPGQGSTQHILTAALLKAHGIEGLHVPFTGAGPMAQAALGGQIHMFIESGSIPAATGLPVLGVLARDRLAGLPAVPTLAELGQPLEGSSHGGILAPSGIPEAAAAVLERACATAVGAESFRTAAERLNAIPLHLNGAAFRDRFAQESAMNATVLRDLGLAREGTR
ncbi:Bug family tripartite tricarboxylate transporter substrate binding protein [Falsiroseomonas ponticola]|uniref:Bug family tripartite tricarboxylate transporter substrate binding protein n=1 Tax=Falsiroseomonas ponticola TaxID=2786951 RepID=UPI001931C75C|nr:tripartite tricarboxylate transporter substrate binding protein [Roseomonas ponticola]